ncbi:transposase [Spirosoma flavus]
MAPAIRLKRKRKQNPRQIVNVILWLLRTGCQWRNLPDEWPNWQAVYRTDGPVLF